MEHGVGPVVSVVLGVIDGVLPASGQAAGTPMDLDSDPIALRVSADDEPSRIHGGGPGMDGCDLECGRYRVSGVRAAFRRPRASTEHERVRDRAGRRPDLIRVPLGHPAEANHPLEILGRAGLVHYSWRDRRRATSLGPISR